MKYLLVLLLALATPLLSKEHNPKAVEKTEPDFPRSLAREGVTEASAELIFLVDKDGNPSDVVILKASHYIAGLSIKEAIAQWRFEPLEVDGRAVPYRATQEVTIRVEDNVAVMSTMDFILQRSGWKADESYEVANPTLLDPGFTVVHGEAPQYPANLLEEGLTAKVMVDFFVDPEGTVRAPAVINEEVNPLFAHQAIVAIRKFKFSPPRIKERPTTVRVRIPFEFAPPTE